MKVSKRGSRDPEDDTDLEIDDIEDNHHPELETLETTGNPGLPNQLSRDSEDDTDLELETVDLVLDQRSRDWIDIVTEQGSQVRNNRVTEQGSQVRIDIVTEQRSQSQDSQDTEDDRSHVR